LAPLVCHVTSIDTIGASMAEVDPDLIVVEGTDLAPIDDLLGTSNDSSKTLSLERTAMSDKDIANDIAIRMRTRETPRILATVASPQAARQGS
jgi:hypothetical protein